MPRPSSHLDLSIRGDQLEQNRIRLENNLQHTDLSLHLSSAPDEDVSDIEFPRHNSAPSPFSAYASFEHRSGDQFEPQEHSQYHAWSFQSFHHGQDDTVNPYAGETLSTAAHHASALTLSAGLGGRAGKRDVSLSGAEYDPDRPLQGIMAGINTHFSVLGADSTKSRFMASNTVNFDPLVVDDTAELDRVLQSGHASLPSALRSPASSFTSSCSLSEPGSPRPGTPTRPKLSDALQSLAFSPKRPRSAQSHVPARSDINTRSLRSPSITSKFLPPVLSNRSSGDTSVAKPAISVRSSSGGQRQTSSLRQNAEIHVQPATPSTSHGSRFAKMAQGLVQEIESEKNSANASWRDPDSLKSAIPQSTVRHARVAQSDKRRNPFKSITNQVHAPVALASPAAQGTKARTPFKSRIHLPDVTGLTSAVDSPARIGFEYRRFHSKGDSDHEARLYATLNAVQSKLAFLESENSVSRRRVHELELELEACKQEVVRERTKILEREELVAQRAANLLSQERERLVDMDRSTRGYSRNRKMDGSMNAQEALRNDSRYKEAVEEKKALEALISTLRTHLSRLTAELSDHQRLLTDLRTMRDSDARALTEKSQDVDKLRQEVERLAGEVEVLKGVVEEGLKERRIAREQASCELSGDDQTSRIGDSNADNEPDISSVNSLARSKPTIHTSESDDEDVVSEVSDPRSPTPSPRRHAGLADGTMRTDHATIGSSQPIDDLSTKPFLDGEELDRISVDIQDRRVERSTLSASRSAVSSRFISPVHSHVTSRASDLSHRSHHEPHSSRSTTPTPLHGTAEPDAGDRPSESNGLAHREAAADQTPFPQIRGAHLERLFYSAPEHNAQTCTVCHRRRRRSDRGVLQDEDRIPFWLSGRRRAHRPPDVTEDTDVDEGFVEGSEEDNRAHLRPGEAARTRARGSPIQQSDDRLPPQTVLTRVLRELEDDFTHYKRSAMVVQCHDLANSPGGHISIYIELADQYKLMDAVSNVVKRNVVAGNLREVIDLLEQKGDQIASLYDLLSFQDKPENPVATQHSRESMSRPLSRPGLKPRPTPS
ncbi:uncharacterized protein FIBRA_08377 [Fibroporia radiculosa]|uniref:Cep57 centrosome microtubule-binding domain-containing protein n=1 Tax=Fibroporia radiculosa TaxID=599839 RepID=J4GH85_9APHY|nr:uncharacterized protein FIBRA_08377 [Fibroporia radiculosa]CCM06128.1 predicted protein [Fibroporia radiculosa]